MQRVYKNHLKPFLQAFIIMAFAVIVGCATSIDAIEQIKKTAVSESQKDNKNPQPAKKTSDKESTVKDKGSVINPDDPSSPIYLGTKGELAGRGDPDKPVSEAYKKGMGWHPQALQTAGLPKDRFGLVDWSKMVKEGIIRPKASLDPSASEIPPLDLEIIIEAKGSFVDDAIFPHRMHTYWLNCETCHTRLFVPEKGQNKMSMAGMVRGQWCGKCHGRVAFPLTDCTRCHTIPKKH